MYHKFDTVVKLQVNERARGSSNDQQLFRELQIRARECNSSLEDLKLLLTRVPDNIPNRTEFEKESVRLSFGNENVARDNYAKLRNLNELIVQVDAKHSCNKAKHLPAEDMGGLEPKIYLSKNARVMLTRNLWVDVGLCNGAMGNDIDIIYAENHCPPELPIAILVQFDTKNYTGPTFLDHIPNCVLSIP